MAADWRSEVEGADPESTSPAEQAIGFTARIAGVHVPRGQAASIMEPHMTHRGEVSPPVAAAIGMPLTNPQRVRIARGLEEEDEMSAGSHGAHEGSEEEEGLDAAAGKDDESEEESEAAEGPQRRDMAVEVAQAADWQAMEEATLLWVLSSDVDPAGARDRSSSRARATPHDRPRSASPVEEERRAPEQSRHVAEAPMEVYRAQLFPCSQLSQQRCPCPPNE